MQTIARNAGNDPSGIIGASDKFSAALQGNDVFQKSVRKHYENIRRHGILEAASMVSGPQAIAQQQLKAGMPEVING